MYAIDELEAVNDILAASGEAPITSLANLNPLEEAQLVLNELTRERRRLLAEGWAFNTNPRYELTQDIDGRVPIGDNVLSIEAVFEANLVVRNGYIWDSYNNTDVINKNVEVSAILLQEFDELPFLAQDVIVLTAGLKYLTRYDTANDERWSAANAYEAYDKLAQEDITVGGYGYSYTRMGRELVTRAPIRTRTR